MFLKDKKIKEKDNYGIDIVGESNEIVKTNEENNTRIFVEVMDESDVSVEENLDSEFESHDEEGDYLSKQKNKIEKRYKKHSLERRSFAELACEKEVVNNFDFNRPLFLNTHCSYLLEEPKVVYSNTELSSINQLIDSLINETVKFNELLIDTQNFSNPISADNCFILTDTVTDRCLNIIYDIFVIDLRNLKEKYSHNVVAKNEYNDYIRSLWYRLLVYLKDFNEISKVEGRNLIFETRLEPGVYRSKHIKEETMIDFRFRHFIIDYLQNIKSMLSNFQIKNNNSYLKRGKREIVDKVTYIISKSLRTAAIDKKCQILNIQNDNSEKISMEESELTQEKHKISSKTTIFPPVNKPETPASFYNDDLITAEYLPTFKITDIQQNKTLLSEVNRSEGQLVNSTNSAFLMLAGVFGGLLFVIIILVIFKVFKRFKSKKKRRNSVLLEEQ